MAEENIEIPRVGKDIETMKHHLQMQSGANMGTPDDAVSSAENPRVGKDFQTMKQSGANMGTPDDAVSSAENPRVGKDFLTMKQSGANMGTPDDAVSSAENPRVGKDFQTMKLSGANMGTPDDAVSSAEKLINEVAEAEAGASGGTSKRKSEDADEDGKNKKQKNDSIAPNRAMSGFMFFSKTETESLKKTDPGISDLDLSIKVGNKWMDMSDEEKEPFEKSALADKKRYVDEIRRFKN